MSLEQATFGLKKGFLNGSSSKPSKKKSQSKAKATNGTNNVKPSKQSTSSTVEVSKSTVIMCSMLSRCTNYSNYYLLQNNLIYELDNEGNMVPIEQTEPKSSIFTEAQNTLAADLASNTEWATSDLLETISNHPKLAAGMSNPKYTAALQSMQCKPKETMERLRNEDPEVLEFLNEFCGVMGDHFCKLGEEQKSTNAKATNNSNAGIEKVREMGVLEEKAMRKHKTEIDKLTNNTQNKSNNTDIAAADEHVASILSNDELRSILLDTKMQQILQECSTQNGKLHYYMRHEEYGPKLRKLMEVGLLRVA